MVGDLLPGRRDCWADEHAGEQQLGAGVGDAEVHESGDRDGGGAAGEPGAELRAGELRVHEREQQDRGRLPGSFRSVGGDPHVEGFALLRFAGRARYIGPASMLQSVG